MQPKTTDTTVWPRQVSCLMVDVATARIVLGSEVECEANCGQEQLDLLRCGTFVPDTHTHTLAALALSSALFDLAHSRGLFGRRFHLGIPALLGQGSLWLNLTSSFGPTAKSCKNRFIELLQNSNKDCVKTCRGTARGNA